MKTFTASVVLLILAGIHPAAEAGLLGTTPISVKCDTTITVTDAIAFLTLTLDSTDPIFSTVCTGDGITIKNQGKDSEGRGLTLDCQANTLRGSKKGIGIELRGFNLAAFQCNVVGFKNGIVVSGDGGNLEDNLVQNAASDGFVLKDSLGVKSSKLVGSTVVGNRALDNGGWGFDLKGNLMSVGTGSFFNNLAIGNAEGGFQVSGEGVGISGNEAIKNGGPGFSITSSNCCAGALGQALASALAMLNTGPGVIYVGRNDLSNCVGSTDPACVGGTFFPAGFDTTRGAISSFANGTTCPKGSLPFAPGICPITKGARCTQSVLDNC
jgi:hypothetical protein